MEPQDNITFRRAQTQLNINQSELEMSNDALDGTTSSLPDLSVDLNEQVKMLLEKIQQLQIQLNSAHSEIEQISLENRELIQSNIELKKKNDLLKKIGYSPTSKCISPSSTLRKTAKPLPKSKAHKQTQTHTQMKEIVNGTTEKIHRETQTNVESYQKVSPSKQAQTINLSKKEHRRPTYNISNMAKNQGNINHQSATYVPKICLISSNKQNKVLSIAQTTLHNDSGVCHYLTPNGCTKQTLEGIQTKLTGFTMEDYCIIFIGDQDFLEINNNLRLIDYIREVIQVITHTNIILCTPTYQYGYNKEAINIRIHNFNNLLQQDIDTYNYAYLIDTNRHLVYDYSMFHKPSGMINNTGIRVIFKDLTRYINKNKEFISCRESFTTDLSSVEHGHMKNQLFLE